MATLLFSLLAPLVGAGLIWALGSSRSEQARLIALVTSLVTLAAALLIAWDYVPGGGTQFAASYDWLGQGGAGWDVRLALGLDELSLLLYVLSALLSVTAILVSWEAISQRPGAFYALLLLLESGMLGVFAARDIILFYVFFEFTLIPLFFLIGVWGSEQRQYAATKFFLYTFAGSVLTFLGLLAIVTWVHSRTGTLTFSYDALAAALARHELPAEYQIGIFVALFAGFAIKVPLFPLHTWLPLAHVQAPTAGSVLLAGVLLKIGGYGFLRFCIPLLPDATLTLAPWMLWLSVAGILYGALVALAQSDIKRLIAYSSVSHLGFCLLGLFALNSTGIQGGTLQMLNHGLSTGGLFAIVGMLYERYHTREISSFSGLAKRLPLLTLMMLVFTFSSIGLPGLNGFVGEFLALAGAFQRGWGAESWDAPSWELRTISVLAVSGVVLGAWYMLSLVQRVFFGPLKEPHETGHAHGPVRDMNAREAVALVPLVVVMVWIGVAPQYFLERLPRSAHNTMSQLAGPGVNSPAPPALAQDGGRHGQ